MSELRVGMSAGLQNSLSYVDGARCPATAPKAFESAAVNVITTGNNAVRETIQLLRNLATILQGLDVTSREVTYLSRVFGVFRKPNWPALSDPPGSELSGPA